MALEKPGKLAEFFLFFFVAKVLVSYKLISVEPVIDHDL